MAKVGIMGGIRAALAVVLIVQIAALHVARITQARVDLLHVRPRHEKVEIVDDVVLGRHVDTV